MSVPTRATHRTHLNTETVRVLSWYYYFVYGCFTYRKACAPHAWLVPIENRRLWIPRTAVIVSYESSCRCWEWNLGPLGGQAVLWTAEPSLSLLLTFWLLAFEIGFLCRLGWPQLRDLPISTSWVLALRATMSGFFSPKFSQLTSITWNLNPFWFYLEIKLCGCCRNQEVGTPSTFKSFLKK